MARPGFHNHPKFRRLVFLLKEPVPHVRGYLECLWDVAYENGNPVIGDQSDVELAAQFPGEPGKLAKALLECGGQRVGLIECVGESDIYQIHDLYDHAPEYVRKRRQREIERKSVTGNLSDRRMADNGRTPADNGAPPAPAPAPAPAPTITPMAPASVSAAPTANPPADEDDDFAGDFSRGWAQAKAKLSAMGVTRWREAIEDAKGNGCTPGHVMELLAFAKANSYSAGAVVYRVSRARMTLPVAEGWPPKPADQAAAKGRTADREAAAEAENARKVRDSEEAAADRERRFGAELDAMPPEEVAEMVKPNPAMAKLFRKGPSPLVRDWLLVQLQKRAEVLS